MEIRKRVLRHAKIFLNRGETIRSTAKQTGWSKSTVGKDLKNRLGEYNPQLHLKVLEKLAINKNSASMRGGMSTSKLWAERNANK